MAKKNPAPLRDNLEYQRLKRDLKRMQKEGKRLPSEEDLREEFHTTEQSYEKGKRKK